MTGLEIVTSRRVWFVPDFSVWGQPSLGVHEYLALEQADSTWSIYYGSAAIGDNSQEVLFSQLTDHRGNSLPASMESPRVFARAQDGTPVFVVGREGADRFKIAHAANAAGPVAVDLMIVELGD